MDWNWVPGAITGTLALIGVMVAGWLQARRERNSDQRKSATPGAPTVQEIWQRQDKMENAFKASLVLLGEFAEQWSHENPPKLSQRALAILKNGDYLPPELDHLIEP